MSDLDQMPPTMRLALQIAKVASARSAARAENKGSEALGAWFLGPKAENSALLEELIDQAIAAHSEDRRSFREKDPTWLTEERKASSAYQAGVKTLREEFTGLLNELRGSVPFYSYRYQGHMLWDITLPSIVGYFAAMLHNQNNVSAEASPVTTQLEIEVGDELCKMLGFQVDEQADVRAWGHITCDGSVANSEAMWAARNLKYYALGIAAAIREHSTDQNPALKDAVSLDIELPWGGRGTLVDLTSWELLNLDADEVLGLPQRVKDMCGAKDPKSEQAQAIDAIIEGNTVQELGFLEFWRRLASDVNDPVILTPATAHYSWPKAAALLGLGRGTVRAVPVDLDGRMDAAELKNELERCLTEQRPLIMAVSVLGTTEESAVDPLAKVLELRDEYRKKGLDFWLHVDGAWGGYFASMLREPEGHKGGLSALNKADTESSDTSTAVHTRFFEPEIAMSSYVNDQYKVIGHADSITIDPHKAGYIPYPAGGLCYRNSAMRHLVAFTAPVVFHGDTDPTVGLYGIEGSKPGAAVASTWLSHRVIRPDQSGYGRILSRCMWNSKLFYANLVAMADETDPFRVVPFQRLPIEREKGQDCTEEDVKAQVDFIRERVVPLTDDQLIIALQDEALREQFREFGSDQVIVSYAFNFLRDGKPNTDVALLNALNDNIFSRLSLMVDTHNSPDQPLFVTSSQFDPAIYGSPTVDDYKRRLGVVDDTGAPVNFLISTTMNPYLSDTAEGNMIPRLIAALKEVVLEETAKLLSDNP